MGVSLFWNQGQLRWSPDHTAYGDQYETIVTIQRMGKRRAYLSGGCGKLPVSAQLEILRALYAEGIRTVEWERLRNDQERVVVIEIDPKRIGMGGVHE